MKHISGANALLTNIRLVQNFLPGTNTLAYFPEHQ